MRSHDSPALPDERRALCGSRAAVLLLLVLAVFPALAGCGKDSTSPGDGGATWDIDAKGIPQFVTTNYIDPVSIDRISRFRSGYGHDYTHDDHLETCRSMKHYFWPKGGDPGRPHVPSWTAIPVTSPVSGTVTRAEAEFEGTQIWIQADDHPAFEFRIFHVALSTPLEVGSTVTEGQVLGHHGGDDTMSDIAVRVATPKGWRLVSYFDVLTDELFQSYRSLGVDSRSQVIITREERDGDPLTCDGETFTSEGNLQNWVLLTPGEGRVGGPGRRPRLDADSGRINSSIFFSSY